MMARKQTTDSDDERAVDKLLASWPIGAGYRRRAREDGHGAHGSRRAVEDDGVEGDAEIDQDPVIPGRGRRRPRGRDRAPPGGRPAAAQGASEAQEEEAEEAEEEVEAFVLRPRERDAPASSRRTQADVAAADAALKKMEAELAATLQSPESAPPPPPPRDTPRGPPDRAPRAAVPPEERRAAAGRGAAHAPLATPAADVKPAAEAPLAAETQETARAPAVAPGSSPSAEPLHRDRRDH